jgi:aminopeptidase N
MLTDIYNLALYSRTVLTESYGFYRNRRVVQNEKRRSAPDPESTAIWKSLEAAEIKACCKAMELWLKQWRYPYLELSSDKRTIAKVQIQFCPECGRKLK